MPSLSQQSTAELGGRVSVLTRQKSDHVELDRLLRRLDDATDDDELAVLLEIHRLVFPHAFAEESVLWPVMRRVLPDGEELTLQVEQEHQEVNEIVTRLESLPVGSADRGPLLARLAEVLREDVRDEEDQLFPRLQERVSTRELRLLGVAWEVVRRVAPTRAHPIVARRPPGNVIAALPLSALDRARDRLDRRRLVASRPSRVMGAASGFLARASHAVEHLPMMRIGEDASTARGSVRAATALLWAGAAVVGVIALARRSARSASLSR